MDWTGRLHSFNLIAQGTSQTTRVGNKITPKMIVWRLRFYNSLQNDPRAITMIVFRDRQQVGDSAPSPSDLISPATIGTTAAPHALLNTANVGRFKILFRRTWTLEDKDSGKSSVVSIRTLRSAPVTIRFNGGNTTDIEGNGLYCLWISDGDPAADAVLMTGEIRMWYTDV